LVTVLTNVLNVNVFIFRFVDGRYVSIQKQQVPNLQSETEVITEKNAGHMIPMQNKQGNFVILDENTENSTNLHSGYEDGDALIVGPNDIDSSTHSTVTSFMVMERRGPTKRFQAKKVAPFTLRGQDTESPKEKKQHDISYDSFIEKRFDGYRRNMALVNIKAWMSRRYGYRYFDPLASSILKK
jgi:hypothetical protein